MMLTTKYALTWPGGCLPWGLLKGKSLVLSHRDPMPDDSSDIDNSPDPGILTRRRMFGMLALTGAGLLASTPKASAFFNFFELYAPSPAGSLSGLDIPEEWRRSLGSALPSYAQFIKNLGLRNVKVRQVVAPHTKKRGSVQNTLPPRPLWKNIRETLKVIDGLSHRLDLPAKDLVSIYRSPSYNSRCPGARSNSYHVRNNAVDITFPCAPGKVTAMAREMRAAGIFRGGIGRYGGFTHIDTRGANVDWRF